MRFDIITIFPEFFDSFLKTSLMARGIKKRAVKIKVHNLRDAAGGKHKSVDDRPYGGGAGMVMRVDVVEKMLSKVLKLSSISRDDTRIILLTPQGKVFNQSHARRLALRRRLVLICGRYEGFDERIRYLVDEEVSIGDYILSGGEIAAMALIDSVARNLKGFLGKESSLDEESFTFGKDKVNSKKNSEGILEYPQYTRPEVWRGKKVPKVLLSGDHRAVEDWRLKKALSRTKKRRPDLLD